MFFEMQLAAENVAAPLGPDMNPVLSRITIYARGNGFEDISRSLGLGILGPLSADQQGDISDGERFNVEAFFDIIYDIEFTDTDPDEDYDPDFSPSQGRIKLRLPRDQSSRITAQGICIADTSRPNFGCVPQLVDPRDPQLTALNFPLWVRNNTFPLGSGATLSLPDTDLVSTFKEQIPLGGNAIFTDGFESGDTSAWVVSRTSSTGSSTQTSTMSPFVVTTAVPLRFRKVWWSRAAGRRTISP